MTSLSNPGAQSSASGLLWIALKVGTWTLIQVVTTYCQIHSDSVGCFKMNLRVVVILLIFVHLYRFSFLRGCNVFVVQFWSDSEMTLSQVSLRSAFLVCHFSSICSTCSPRLKKQVGKCLQQSVWLSQTDWLGPSHAGLETGWWPPVNHWLLGKNSFAMTRCKRLLVKPKSCRPRHWSGTHW